MTALIVGVACLFSTLLIYSGTVISFLRFEHTLLFVGTFAETTLLAATLFGALFLGLSLAGKRLPSMLLGAGGGMLYLCCALAFAYFSWFGSLGCSSRLPWPPPSATCAWRSRGGAYARVSKSSARSSPFPLPACYRPGSAFCTPCCPCQA